MVMLWDSVRPGGAVEMDVATGPGASYDGLRCALEALRLQGATFGQLPHTRPAEWAQLFPGLGTGPVLEDVALAPSERRLHRESEQVYRVLTVAAAALCAGSVELDRPLSIGGIARCDLTSLRGFMRAAEHAETVPGARLVVVGPMECDDATSADTDYRSERLRCLRRMGLSVSLSDLTVQPRGAVTRSPVTGPEAELFGSALGDGTAVDRVAAALAYTRLAFFSTNWEGMAVVASVATRLLPALSDSDVDSVVLRAAAHDGLAAAIELEPGILRSVADIRSYLAKVAGIQASYRGDQNAALRHFHEMHEVGEALSPELRAQSHLYRALTLSKRSRKLDEASAELDLGFRAVAPRPDEPDSVRRERGWLHNLRGLTLFAQRRLKSAFEQEKAALGCLDGLTDASSAHLRINLYSNISVLQEKAGRHEQSLATWEKFSQASGSTDPAFRKHHSYRSGGLRLAMGERSAALDDIAVTLECADRCRDDFHECEVRLELAGLHVDGDERDAAYEHYRLAEDAARRLGDPMRIAQAVAGQVLATGDRVRAEEAARLARASTTQPDRAEQLAQAVTVDRDVSAMLPRPRTKLNRPFDTVNFQD